MRKLWLFSAFALALAVAACVDASNPNAAHDSGPKFILKRVEVDGNRRLCHYERGYYVPDADTKVIALSSDQYCPAAL